MSYYTVCGSVHFLLFKVIFVMPGDNDMPWLSTWVNIYGPMPSFKPFDIVF